MKSPLAKFLCTVAVLLIAGYAVVSLVGPQGVSGLLEKRKQVQELEKRNAALAREIEQKRSRIGRLRDNETDQELEIRQRLKLVKPDEKVFMLQDQGKTER
jgi:cell division protein FtsB